MPQSDKAIEHDLLNAHREKDNFKLCALYSKAAEATCDVNTACFLATQAYVFGLQSNHPFVGRLHAFLKKHGREE